MHARHSGFLEELASGTGLPEAEYAEVARGYRLLRIIDHWADGTSIAELGEALADIAVPERCNVPWDPRGAVGDVLHALVAAEDYPTGRTGVAVALLRWTKTLHEAAMFHIALDVITVALEHTADDPSVAWRCHWDAAFIHRSIGNVAAAEEHYGLCIEIGERIGDDEAVFRGRLGFGRLQRARGDLPAAEHAFRLLLDEARRIGTGGLVSAALQDLGVTIGMRGRHDESLIYLDESLAAASDDDRDGMLLNIAFSHTELGDHLSSRRVYQKLATDARNARIRIVARINLIHTAGLLRDRAAVEAHRRVLEPQRLVATQSTDFWLTLGRAYLAIGELVEARPCFERALTIGQQSRMGQVIIAAEDALATIDMLASGGFGGRVRTLGCSLSSGRRTSIALRSLMNGSVS
jgi:tetratricopeptide (TPR) repeat protein